MLVLQEGYGASTEYTRTHCESGTHAHTARVVLTHTLQGQCARARCEGSTHAHTARTVRTHTLQGAVSTHTLWRRYACTHQGVVRTRTALTQAGVYTAQGSTRTYAVSEHAGAVHAATRTQGATTHAMYAHKRRARPTQSKRNDRQRSSPEGSLLCRCPSNNQTHATVKPHREQINWGGSTQSSVVVSTG